MDDVVTVNGDGRRGFAASRGKLLELWLELWCNEQVAPYECFGAGPLGGADLA